MYSPFFVLSPISVLGPLLGCFCSTSGLGFREEGMQRIAKDYCSCFVFYHKAISDECP